MNHLPKILVGCPTYDKKSYCWEKWKDSLKSLTYTNFDILIADNSKENDFFELMKKDVPVIKARYDENVKERIVNSRNMIREKFLEGDYDFFLSLEQDVFPPKDVIEKLLSNNKEIASGVYCKLMKSIEGAAVKMPVLYIKRKDNELGPMYPHEIVNKGLVRIDACGLGCMLIKKEVLQKVKFRYKEDKSSYDDMWFCKDAKEKGYKIYADGNVLCGHWVSN
jgi:GT2 family glycosyltransferase